MSEQTGAHATTGTYLRIAAILVMITLIEVACSTSPRFQSVLVPVLLVLSAVKFTLVVSSTCTSSSTIVFFTFLFGGPLLLGSWWWSACSSSFMRTVRLRTGM